MADFTGWRDQQGDLRDTAEHPLRAEAFGQALDMRDAVEQGQDQRPLAHRRRKVADGGLQVIGFAAQQNQVICTADLVFGDGAHRA